MARRLRPVVAAVKDTFSAEPFDLRMLGRGAFVTIIGQVPAYLAFSQIRRYEEPVGEPAFALFGGIERRPAACGAFDDDPGAEYVEFHWIGPAGYRDAERLRGSVSRMR